MTASAAAATAVAAATDPAQQSRLAGDERFSTAVAVSESIAAVPTPRVFVANGREFADGLTGGAAAAHDGSPLLLVETDRIPSATAAEIVRLDPREIVVLGGESAVSASVVASLERHAPVASWHGADRYATSAEISHRSVDAGADVAYVASGQVYPDALAAAAVAGAADASVLLVKADAVPREVQTELSRLRPDRIVVLGGPERVSSSVVTTLARYSDAVVQVAGTDRYATSVQTAQEGYPHGAGTVFIASGDDFPDALAGASAARVAGAPVLLVQDSRIPRSVDWELRRLAPDRVVALGGTAAVSDSVLRDAVRLATAGSALARGDGNRILAAPSASLEHLQDRARAIGGNDLFVNDMTPALYFVALRYGIDPTVMVAQAFHETGGGKFGRAVTPAHHNTCGLKVRNPVGPDTNPADHARFSSWEQGATAHAQHLYAYTGTPLPAGEVNIDPRWVWVYGNHEVRTVVELGGKWAPSPTYGELVNRVAVRLLAG